MTRTRYGSLGAGGLNWDSPPLRLLAGGNAKFWDPADIDFSFGAISSARGRPVGEIDLDYSPLQLEDDFADEDAKTLAARYPTQTVLALQNARMPWPASSRP